MGMSLSVVGECSVVVITWPSQGYNPGSNPGIRTSCPYLGPERDSAILETITVIKSVDRLHDDNMLSVSSFHVAILTYAGPRIRSQ